MRRKSGPRLTVEMQCSCCERNFFGSRWRRTNSRDRRCPLCRGVAGNDWGLSVDPYTNGLERISMSTGEPNWAINALMEGMI